MKGHIKNRSLMTGGMIPVLLLTMLCSCDSEDFPGTDTPENVCDNICFGISPENNVMTRGIAADKSEEYTADRFVLRSADSSDTICVRTVISDGICLYDDETVTRGVPVDNSNFYNKFHVVAYWQKGGVAVNQFYLNDEATNNGSNIWSTGNVYYWPGAGHSFRFYAWAPTDAGLAAPADPSSTTLTYTVPDAVTDQRDIVVATTADIAGDRNTAVPLTFSHIATAVRFVVGSSMQPGTIERVSINGVSYSGSYDMSAEAWALNTGTKNFTQALGKATSGTETDNDPITPPEGTFMMLPQTLGADAVVEVLFRNANGQERTLSAPIGGKEWPMGKTVTYKLSITPEYELDIDVPADPQDAHYITFPVAVNVKDYDGEWTLTSNLTSDVFFTAEKTELQQQGYWIDEDKGQPSVTGTGSGTFTYHVYVTENIGDTARDLVFQIKPDTEGAEATTATVSQLCPGWNAEGKGYERIEENNGGNYPFGFMWDRKVVFTAEPGFTWPPSLRQLFGAYVFRDIAQNAKTAHGDPDYLQINLTRGFLNLITKTEVVLDYAKISGLEGVTNETDGLENTRNLYFHQGIGDIVDVENQLRNNAVGNFTEQVEGGEQTTVENFAARMAVMKNKFNKEEVTVGEGEQQTKIWVPKITRENIVWYLPAINEQTNISDSDYPLSGTYWSSTAAHDNINAYKYSDGVSTSYDRMTNYKVRAVRAKQ